MQQYSGSVLPFPPVIPSATQIQHGTMLLRYALPAMGALFTFVAQAQPNLTAANDVPLNNDQFGIQTVDGFTSEGGGGANVDYNYWDMLIPNTGFRNIRWFDASVTPSAALVPAATMISTDGGADTLYWAVTANGLEQVGARSALYATTINYSDALLELKLPCTYLTSWSDNHSANYTISGFPVTRVGTITGIADAYGVLRLPSGFQHDVLRVKLRRSITDAAAIATTVRKETVFNYYEEGGRYPRLHLRIDSVQINGGAWAVTRRAEWQGQGFVVGLDEAFSDADVFTAFPNPATDAVTVNAPLGPGSRLEIADAAGRVVRSENLTKEQSVLSVSGLPAGVYHLNLITSSGGRRSQRVVVQ